MADEELKKLPAEERIKKLKELEKKKKEEIEEAQKGIREGESELRDRRKWVERVPIPEFAREDLGNLSEDAQKILEQHRGIGVREKAQSKEKERTGQKEKEEQSSRKSSSALEETVQKERVELSPEAQQAQYGAPGMSISIGYQPMSQMNMMGISKEIKNIYQAVEERGYITGSEQKRVGYALSEVERRIESAEEGEYKGFNEQVAEAANLIQAIGKSMYHSGKSGSNQMYRS